MPSEGTSAGLAQRRSRSSQGKISKVGDRIGTHQTHARNPKTSACASALGNYDVHAKGCFFPEVKLNMEWHEGTDVYVEAIGALLDKHEVEFLSSVVKLLQGGLRLLLLNPSSKSNTVLIGTNVSTVFPWD